MRLILVFYSRSDYVDSPTFDVVEKPVKNNLDEFLTRSTKFGIFLARKSADLIQSVCSLKNSVHSQSQS